MAIGAEYALAWNVLVFVVLPLWLAAGFCDYLCHRAAHIARANGARESLLHWLMLAEIGLPLLAVTFFKINALLFVVMAACLIAHEITTHLDLRLALRTREVSATEQQVHSFLEVLPVTAFLLLAILHSEQALALIGLGPVHADFALMLKAMPTAGELLALFGSLLVFGGLPYAEELWRGLRAEKQNGVHF